MKFLHWYINPIKSHYLDFSGRATRQEYWMYVLWFVIFAAIVSLIEVVTGITFLYHIYVLGLLLPSLALGARRLHDVGMSGWWQLLNIVPIIGTIILLILFIRTGQPESNKYGANPLTS